MSEWYAASTIVTVQDKDQKDLRASRNATPPPPGAENGVGAAGHPATPALDLDLEELSGSLLVDENLQRASRAADIAKPRSVPPPLPTSLRPLGPSSVPPPLPKPSPPPRIGPPPLPRTDPPPPAVAAGEKLEPVDVEVTFQPDDSAVVPPPPPPSAPDTADTLIAPVPVHEPEFSATAVNPEHALTRPVERAELGMPDPPAMSEPLGAEVDLNTLPRGVLSPLFGPPPNEAQSTSAMPPAADASGKSRSKGRRAAAVGAGLVVVAALGVVVTQMRSRTRVPSPSPVASAAAVFASPAPRPSPPPSPSPTPAAGGCAVAGDPRVVAPNAIVAPGIEVRALGDEFAMGFASGDHHATLVRLDAVSLAATASSTKPWAQAIRRVTPFVGKKGKIGLSIDGDKKGDNLHGRRTLELDPPLQIGVSDKHLAWALLRHKPAGKLWPLDGETAIEAPRAARSETAPSSTEIVFRSGGSLWVGEAEESGSSLSAKGNLARVGDEGAMVGAPAIALNEGSVLMAWAERKSTDDPWRLRWVRFKAGESPGAARTFVPPAGGRGEQAMAPGIAALSGGRFLLVWTEGPASEHEVRGLTLSNEGMPVGAPMRISGAGANAGQGQPAVSANGNGVVAFLEAKGGGFEVVATPIRCAL